MRNKKGSNSTMIVVIVMMVLVVGVSVWLAISYNNNQEQAASVAPSQTYLTETGTQTSTAKVSCPSDGTTSGQVRYEDTLASSTTYLNPTVYFMPKSDGQERVTAGALTTDGTFSTASDLPCTSVGTQWQAVAVAGQNSSHSVVEGDTFTAEGAFVKRTLYGKAYGDLQFKVEDKFTGGAKYFNITTCTASPSEGWEAVNTTQCIIANGDSTGTSLTIGADGYIDARIFMKTAATKDQFGEDGLRTWFLVDANSDKWDEPIIARDNGATLQNQISSLVEYDARKYTGFEYAYVIGPISDRESYIDFYLETADGVNPGATDDPIIEFCSESRYNSQKEIDTIKVGCWNDATTQLQVSTAVRHHLKFDVS